MFWTAALFVHTFLVGPQGLRAQMEIAPAWQQQRAFRSHRPNPETERLILDRRRLLWHPSALQLPSPSKFFVACHQTSHYRSIGEEDLRARSSSVRHSPRVRLLTLRFLSHVVPKPRHYSGPLAVLCSKLHRARYPSELDSDIWQLQISKLENPHINILGLQGRPGRRAGRPRRCDACQNPA